MSDLNDEKLKSTDNTEQRSFISNLIYEHKTDIAIYLSAIAIVVSVAVHGAIVSERNKDSDIHYRYFDSGLDSSVTDAAQAMAPVSSADSVQAKTDSSEGVETTAAKVPPDDPKTSKVDTAASHTVFPIDINRATYEQLLEISGIGEVLAANIIAYRERVGIIHDIAQLIEVNGIGQGRLETLRQYLYVDPSDYIPYEPNSPAGSGTAAAQTKPPNEQPSDSQSDEPQIVPETEQPHYSYVNINTADAEELMRCLLITEPQALAIIALREQIGYFSSVEELILTDAFTAAEIVAFRDYILFE